jgi:hypothetical protein
MALYPVEPRQITAGDVKTLWHAVHHILEPDALARVVSAFRVPVIALTVQSIRGAIYSVSLDDEAIALGDD